MTTRPLQQFLKPYGRFGSMQTLESAGWLVILLALGVKATQKNTHKGEWLYVDMLIGEQYHHGLTYPTLCDVLLECGQMKTIITSHGALQPYMDMAIDSMLDEIAGYVWEQEPDKRDDLLRLLVCLDDYQLDVDAVVHAMHPKQELKRALRKHYFVTALRIAYVRLVFTGDWTYWGVFEAVFPPGSKVRQEAHALAYKCLEEYGPLFRPGWLSSLHPELERIVMDMIYGRVDGGVDLVNRVLPGVCPTRHIVLMPDQSAAMADQRQRQIRRVAVGQQVADHDRMILLRVVPYK